MRRSLIISSAFSENLHPIHPLMRARPVTVDSIDISAHQRYANDQANLDPALKNPTLLAHHSEIVATTTNFATKHEELFGLKTSISWALFSPPPTSWRSKRFFSFRLSEKLFFYSPRKEVPAPATLPSLYSQEQKQPVDSKEILLNKIEETTTSQPHHHKIALEEEKHILLKMVLCIDHLNQLIAEIHAKKNQHQKG